MTTVHVSALKTLCLWKTQRIDLELIECYFNILQIITVLCVVFQPCQYAQYTTTTCPLKHVFHAVGLTVVGSVCIQTDPYHTDCVWIHIDHMTSVCQPVITS